MASQKNPIDRAWRAQCWRRKNACSLPRVIEVSQGKCNENYQMVYQIKASCFEKPGGQKQFPARSSFQLEGFQLLPEVVSNFVLNSGTFWSLPMSKMSVPLAHRKKRTFCALLPRSSPLAPQLLQLNNCCHPQYAEQGSWRACVDTKFSATEPWHKTELQVAAFTLHKWSKIPLDLE